MQYQCGYLFCPIVFRTSYKKKEKSLAPFFDWKLKISKECKVEPNPEDNINLSKIRNVEIAQQLILKSRQSDWLNLRWTKMLYILYYLPF